MIRSAMPLLAFEKPSIFNKNAVFPGHEALGEILGFWVNGVTSQ
jgi:hypothetical protein